MLVQISHGEREGCETPRSAAAPKARGMKALRPLPLAPEAFAPLGDILDATGEHRLINAGLCQRLHDRANLQS